LKLGGTGGNLSGVVVARGWSDGVPNFGAAVSTSVVASESGSAAMAGARPVSTARKTTTHAIHRRKPDDEAKGVSMWSAGSRLRGRVTEA
jgi:hypothetical protein